MVGILVATAIFAVAVAPVQAGSASYGGIGATVTSFYGVNPHGAGKPPAGTTYYRAGNIRGGRVLGYHVVVGWKSQRSGSGLLARLTGRELPSDAKLVKPYNGYCAVYSSRWLGKVLFDLPRRDGKRVFRTGYIIVYAPEYSWWNGVDGSLVPQCRG